jgi:hypothetical protein
VYLHANTHKNGTSELESYKKIDEVNYSAIAELFYKRIDIQMYKVYRLRITLKGLRKMSSFQAQ